MKMTGRFLYLSNLSKRSNGGLAAHVLPSEHPSWILLSLRTIFALT